MNFRVQRDGSATVDTRLWPAPPYLRSALVALIADKEAGRAARRPSCRLAFST
jgi:hypothetical protein